jgi:hypothetical protein
VSIHERIYRHYAVSNSKMRNFLQDQGNQGIARRRTLVRRTSNPED